jgi:hypothetical protein
MHHRSGGGDNLEAAFQQVRSESQPRKLWVDALCINQSNNEERSEQVKLMAKLYSQASLVLCSLAKATKVSDLHLIP